ncbi:MAG: GDP-mannose 4,6-dehydratase [Candidatus Hodarchaeota archaeon]
MTYSKKSRRVLVTGAAGFIGSHLVERLVSEGASVRAFVHYNALNRWGNLELLPVKIRRKVEIFPGDIQDPFSVSMAVEGYDIVYHLAALIAIPYSYIAPQSFGTTNVLGAINIMEACRRLGTHKVVHTSTSECYGTAQYVPIDENHPLQGQSPYSASKIGADMVAESYYRSFGVPVSIIRPFNTYGPRQSARAVIPTIITQILWGHSLKLGNLPPTRDFNYVSDVVDGFIKIAESPKSVGEVINIGSGHEMSITDLAHTIMSILGVWVDIIHDAQRARPEKSEVGRLLCDNTKARNLLGWEPQVGMEEGLRKTIDWIKSNIDTFKPDDYNI